MDKDKNVHLDAIQWLVLGGDAEAVAAYRAQNFPDADWPTVSVALESILHMLKENFTDQFVMLGALLLDDQELLAKAAAMLTHLTMPGQHPTLRITIPSERTSAIYGTSKITGRILSSDLDAVARFLPLQEGATNQGRGTYGTIKTGRVARLLHKYADSPMLSAEALTTPPAAGKPSFVVATGLAPPRGARHAGQGEAEDLPDALHEEEPDPVTDLTADPLLARTRADLTADVAADHTRAFEAAGRHVEALRETLAAAEADFKVQAAQQASRATTRDKRPAPQTEIDPLEPLAKMTKTAVTAQVTAIFQELMASTEAHDPAAEATVLEALTRWDEQRILSDKDATSFSGLLRQHFDDQNPGSNGITLPFKKMPNERALRACGHREDPHYAVRKAAMTEGWEEITKHRENGITITKLLKVATLPQYQRIDYLKRLGKIDFSLCATYMVIALIGTPGSDVMIPDVKALLAPFAGGQLVSNTVYDPHAMPPSDWDALVSNVSKAYLERIKAEVSAAKLTKLLSPAPAGGGRAHRRGAVSPPRVARGTTGGPLCGGAPASDARGARRLGTLASNRRHGRSDPRYHATERRRVPELRVARGEPGAHP